jgi:TPP-dependent pyruvate/acetoin dehydrogenase alpha subunit
MVCQTYRYFGHGMSDRDRPYRTRDEETEWRKLDPIERLGAVLVETGQATPDELKAIVERTQAEILDAVKFGQAAPYPTPDQVKLHVYAN